MQLIVIAKEKTSAGKPTGCCKKRNTGNEIDDEGSQKAESKKENKKQMRMNETPHEQFQEHKTTVFVLARSWSESLIWKASCSEEEERNNKESRGQSGKLNTHQ